MDILLNCPHCEGTASFRPPRGGGRSTRLFGRCGSCASVFSLSGGRLADVELGPGLDPLTATQRPALRGHRAAAPADDPKRPADLR
ncbi:MAG: hypothetical protein R2702_16025 [Acidimicrobiales bacterium]